MNEMIWGYFLINAIVYVMFLNLNLGFFWVVFKIVDFVHTRPGFLSWIIANIILIGVYTLLNYYMAGL